MTDKKRHIILLVDDERSIVSSLKRMLRKESYDILTASSGSEGLDLFKEHTINLVISDQRMPGMSGSDFLSHVKDSYPDTIRIILSGYTEIDTITDAINKGFIYKFFLKPWNDDLLKNEIKKALDQYDLIKRNRELDDQITIKNNELKEINEKLELKVVERTRELQLKNIALEFSRAVLEDISFPIIGVSDDLVISLINRQAETLEFDSGFISIGSLITTYIGDQLNPLYDKILNNKKDHISHLIEVNNIQFMVHVSALKSLNQAKGMILIMIPEKGNHHL